jgi:hypothetical protein
VLRTLRELALLLGGRVRGFDSGICSSLLLSFRDDPSEIVPQGFSGEARPRFASSCD